MAQAPRILRNYNLFIDGQGFAGIVAMAKLPALKVKTEDWRGGGMDAPMKMDVGMEAMEAEVELAEHAPSVYAAWGMIDGAGIGFVLRGALQADGEAAVPLIATLRGRIDELESNEFKSGERGGVKCKMSVRYYKLEIGGAEQIEIDVDNMVRRIDGRDELASQRAALGL